MSASCRLSAKRRPHTVASAWCQEVHLRGNGCPARYETTDIRRRLPPCACAMFHAIEAKPGTARFAVAGSFETVERFEDLIDVTVRYPGTVVAHANDQLIGSFFRRYLRALAIVDGVVDQIGDAALEQLQRAVPSFRDLTVDGHAPPHASLVASHHDRPRLALHTPNPAVVCWNISRAT
jgi:hypothetical protein